MMNGLDILMSEKLYKLARQYATALNEKQTKIFLKALTEVPFWGKIGRLVLSWKIFWKRPLVRFTKKETAEIKSGHYLK